MNYFQKKHFNYSFKKLLPFINLKRLKHKYLNINKEKEIIYKKYFEEFLHKIEKENLIFVKGIYKCFKAKRQGESIIILNRKKGVEFKFSRQRNGERLCISDFVKKGNFNDLICFFVLTAGLGVKEKSLKLRNDGNFLFSYFLEVLSLEAAEAGAEILNKKISGKRFSFGYPSCPDLSEQKKLFEILKPEKIGIELTENYIMEPESSLSGFIIKNPKAKYFNLEKKWGKQREIYF